MVRVVCWPTLLAWTTVFLILGSLEGVWLISHATKPLPHAFPNIFMQVKKRAVLKGKMFGGTPKVSGARGHEFE